MITPIELQSKTFKTGLGYDKKEVENFLNNLLVDYETLYKDNMELKDKLNVLNEGIHYYKTIEKTLQKALVLAEKTAEDTREAAIKQARAIENDAKGKAQLIVADANNELQRIQQQTIQIIMQYDAYKAQFKHLASAQCEFLESDSFNIHIANLDALAGLNTTNANVNEGNTNDYYHEESNANESIVSDEEFEFYNLNEDE